MRTASIVVVDDDSTLLKAVTGLMELHPPGIHVEAFESPRLALAHFAKVQLP